LVALAGCRTRGCRKTALARPQNIYAYKPESTIAELAAGYAFGLAKNHPFIDGNKRAAFLSIGLFLAINDYALKADQVDAIQTMLALASGTLRKKGWRSGLREVPSRVRATARATV
jgi:death-on-curing protein